MWFICIPVNGTIDLFSSAECLCGDERYKDSSAMRRLLQQRQKEAGAVYHEKKLVDGLVSMCHKLQEHLKGMCVRACTCVHNCMSVLCFVCGMFFFLIEMT